ncbi:hypothetical protein M3Y99_01993900 [Aphelenchoides fujianensis]|nr:hypothetical protein M3Y99_01993900 [Aphelenchoides fujianensis]
MSAHMPRVVAKPPFDGLVLHAGDFDVEAAFDRLAALRPLLLLLDALYVLFVWKGVQLLAGLRPKRLFLRDLSILWNGFNALASFYMFACLLPELLTAFSHGWYYTACKRGTFFTGRWSGHAMYLFCLSKVWELGDTVLLALRGRPVIFLHAFHHSVVMLQVCFTYYSSGSMARLGTVMNSFVHSIMYGYFALQNVVPEVRRVAPLITGLQLAQFVVACVGMLSLVAYVAGGRECETDHAMIPVHFAIYAAFLALFLHFFYHSYVHGRPSKSARSGSKKRSGRSKKKHH